MRASRRRTISLTRAAGAVAEILLKMSSGLFNVICFVFFDLLLADITFYLTADTRGCATPPPRS